MLAFCSRHGIMRSMQITVSSRLRTLRNWLRNGGVEFAICCSSIALCWVLLLLVIAPLLVDGKPHPAVNILVLVWAVLLLVVALIWSSSMILCEVARMRNQK